MVDSLPPERRSENMRRIRSQNTAPEMIVRRMVHAMGYRYRLHVKNLPGKPDLVFPRLRKVIEVYGCFWHGHTACREGRMPATRPEYWVPKLEANRQRDRANRRRLRVLGWSILVIWECETGDRERLQKRLGKFFEPASAPCVDAL
ncbi:MAG: DNA mismatch endonuclease Vsr [Acidobacteriaceae bacterium]|jgi:DNA mismatch endonuclease (patch repair protein)|nr:DNA mismatch endonuclease Vsr [Acidobacteriaceae bacterium]